MSRNDDTQQVPLHAKAEMNSPFSSAGVIDFNRPVYTHPQAVGAPAPVVDRELSLQELVHLHNHNQDNRLMSQQQIHAAMQNNQPNMGFCNPQQVTGSSTMNHAACPQPLNGSSYAQPFNSGSYAQPLNAQHFNSGSCAQPLNAQPFNSGSYAQPLNAQPFNSGSSAEPLNAQSFNSGSSAHPLNAQPFNSGSSAHPLNGGSYAQPFNSGSSAHPLNGGSYAQPFNSGSSAQGPMNNANSYYTTNDNHCNAMNSGTTVNQGPREMHAKQTTKGASKADKRRAFLQSQEQTHEAYERITGSKLSSRLDHLEDRIRKSTENDASILKVCKTHEKKKQIRKDRTHALVAVGGMKVTPKNAHAHS